MLFKIIIAILFLPLVEITFFILAGNFLSMLNIISIILVSAIIGFYNLARAKLGAVQAVQLIFEPAFSAENQVLNALIWCLSGILLIIPGLLTDMVGLALMLYIMLTNKKSPPASPSNSGHNDRKGATIEGEYRNDKH